jgi:hypothetical protein
MIFINMMYSCLYKNGVVNNEIDAYLLGFLYADGCVTNKYKGVYKSISISLSIKDKSFLEQIAKYFGVNIKGDVYGYSYFNGYELKMIDKKLDYL